ncbi:hypothetical protein HYQ45_013358 [Verticillium longisporum]|uniref:Glucose-methanol-choline oxidoreductase N-terminal domain-containing protein n=1 Tax=Verticillium longisporum TaxID=100787 RepID=A0A8I3AJI5_VERLO|nr:hypothetical protein HYQ45_013358 [Verticillium longisporum]
MPSAPSPGLSPQLAPSDVQRRYPKSTVREEVYDYIIVGAGVAGSTLANRLTASREFRVLLLEAGQLDGQEDIITIPGLAGTAAGSKYNWNLTSSPAADTGNRSIALPSGRGVGGGRLINQMVFVRGSVGDFDRWKHFTESRWGWADMFKNFVKSEIFSRPNEDIVENFNVTWDNSLRGTKGNVFAGYSPFWWPSVNNIVSAARELGIRVLKDGSGGDVSGGFFTTHSQTPRNARSSARIAHYDVAAKRANFRLIQNAHVTKVQIERGRAVGVQILQLSGIRDAEELKAHGVQSVVDLPAVGRNLQDHPLLVSVNLINSPLNGGNLSDPTFAAEMMAEYISNRTGPYANPGGEFLMFLPTLNFIKLVSNDSFDFPAVDPGYLSNPLDLAVIVDAFKFARAIVSTEAISQLSPVEIVPGPGVSSDADIESYVRQNLATFAHYAGTCSVGPRSAGGVVDDKFRVHGVKNLRVVDASVIPLLPAAHTSSTVYALAEKAATSILRDVGSGSPGRRDRDQG